MIRMFPIYMLVAIAVFSSPVFADVTITWSMKTVMFDLPPTESVSLEQIRGDRARTTVESTAPGATGMSQEESTAEIFIVRLDQGVMWTLDKTAETFFEIPLAAFGEYDAMVADVIPDDNSDPFIWTLEFHRIADTVITGIPASGMAGTATGVNRKNKKEKAVITYTLWSAEAIPGGEEIVEFSDRFREITGGNFDMQQTVIRTTLSQYCPVYDSLFTGVDAGDRLPVRIQVSVRADGFWDDDGDDDYVSVSAFLEAVAMAEYLGAQTGQERSDGPVTLFSLLSEIVKIDTLALPDSLFQIPEGFTQQE